MIWTKAIAVSLLTSFIVLSISFAVESSAVDSDASDDSDDRDTQTGAGRKVFMAESDASNFFKRRSRRSTYAERIAEQRVQIANNERRREFNEEQSNEHENYLEEDRDGANALSGMFPNPKNGIKLHGDKQAVPPDQVTEQLERSREVNEQFREFEYDGLYSRSRWFH